MVPGNVRFVGQGPSTSGSCQMRLDADEFADLKSAPAPNKGVGGQQLLCRLNVGCLDDGEPTNLDLSGRLRRGEASYRVDRSAGVGHSLAGLREPRAEGGPGLGHEFRVMRHSAAYVGHQELRHREPPGFDLNKPWDRP